jgi:hypothetical protein
MDRRLILLLLHGLALGSLSRAEDLELRWYDGANSGLNAQDVNAVVQVDAQFVAELSALDTFAGKIRMYWDGPPAIPSYLPDLEFTPAPGASIYSEWYEAQDEAPGPLVLGFSDPVLGQTVVDISGQYGGSADDVPIYFVPAGAYGALDAFTWVQEGNNNQPYPDEVVIFYMRFVEPPDQECYVTFELTALIQNYPQGTLELNVGGTTMQTWPVAMASGVNRHYSETVDVGQFNSGGALGVDYVWSYEGQTVASGSILFDGACDSTVGDNGILNGVGESGPDPIPEPASMPDGEGDGMGDRPNPEIPSVDPDIGTVPVVGPPTDNPSIADPNYNASGTLVTQEDYYNAMRQALEDSAGDGVPGGLVTPGAMPDPEFGDVGTQAALEAQASAIDQRDSNIRTGEGFIKQLDPLQLPSGLGTVSTIAGTVPLIDYNFQIDLTQYASPIAIVRGMLLLASMLAAFVAGLRIIRKGVA